MKPRFTWTMDNGRQLGLEPAGAKTKARVLTFYYVPDLMCLQGLPSANPSTELMIVIISRSIIPLRAELEPGISQWLLCVVCSCFSKSPARHAWGVFFFFSLS